MICLGKTKSGKQCTRKPEEGKTLCWQHITTTSMTTTTSTSSHKPKNPENKKIHVEFLSPKTCTFKIKDKVILGDPSYDKELCNDQILRNCRPGTWRAFWHQANFGDQKQNLKDFRCLDLGIVCTNVTEEENKKSSWKEEPIGMFGGIAVDAGMAGIWNFELFPEETDSEDEGSLYNRSQNIVEKSQAGCLPEGAVSASGWGDGIYPVYVMRGEKKEIIAIKITFIQ